jgi:hypothetical protein
MTLIEILVIAVVFCIEGFCIGYIIGVKDKTK